MTKLDFEPPSPTVPSPRSPGIASGRRLSALPVLMCGVFIIVLDFFVVNVALPSMQADLHASTSAIEWVVAGYGLTFAVFLIAAGRLGDRVGRRRTFAGGLALFVVASAACGLAPNPTVLVVARLAQGMAGALISPNVLAIMGVAFPGPARVRAITVYGMVMGLAAAGGQLLGGILIQANLFGWGWRTVFLINVPVGLVALAFTRRLVPESRVEHAGRIDLGGNVLAILGMTALVLPLVEGTQLNWPAWTWVSLTAAPLMFTAFVAHQRRLARRGGTPLLDPALFGQRALLAGLATQLVFWCGQASFFLFLAALPAKGTGPRRPPCWSGLLHSGCGLPGHLDAGSHADPPLRPFAHRRWRRHPGAGRHRACSVAVHGDAGIDRAARPGPGAGGGGHGPVRHAAYDDGLVPRRRRASGLRLGALSTMQQVGNAVGVAVTGVIFFGALSSGYQRAFELALVELAMLLLAVAALTRLLPRARAQQ